jgi:hypothetical protein
MFEGLAKAFSDEMLSLSCGQLQCLPYSRALLDFFDARGKAARPLVVRVVVFGRQNIVGWDELLAVVPVTSLFQAASESPTRMATCRSKSLYMTGVVPGPLSYRIGP